MFDNKYEFPLQTKSTSSYRVPFVFQCVDLPKPTTISHRIRPSIYENTSASIFHDVCWTFEYYSYALGILRFTRKEKEER